MTLSAPEPVVLSWSGGKDSAMALHALRQDPTCRVVALLTTVASEFERISHHGVRATLLQRQAEAVGVPLERVSLPPEPTNEVYEALMEQAMQRFLAQGVRQVAFGDLHLADLRSYRERNLARVGMGARFPLWGSDPADLVRRFLDEGFQATLACVDGRKLDRRFAGRALDDSLLADLPPGVDPCGENGEYHTFVHGGPIFQSPLAIRVGRMVTRDDRHFADLQLADPSV